MPTRWLEALAAEASVDAGFAATVDASVERVLTLKERMGLHPCSTTKPRRARNEPARGTEPTGDAEASRG